MNISRYLAQLWFNCAAPRIAFVVGLAGTIGLVVGCSSPATTWEHRTDLSALCTGRTRTEVLEQFGPPQSTTKSHEGALIDTFEFVQSTRHGEAVGANVQMQSVRLLAITHKSLIDKMLTVRVDYDLHEIIVHTYLMAVAD